ncbi:MAG: phosphopantetheine-binding protein [Jatrophihabitans sp.]
MNDHHEVRKVVLELLVAEGHRGPGPVVAAGSAEGALKLSSLELVRLLVSLEERLGIEFDDAIIMNARFDSVDDIVELVGQSA